MEYDKSDKFLRAAFDTVKRYDPDTYGRMSRAHWRVSTDVPTAFPEAWRQQTSNPFDYMELMEVFGTTLNHDTAKMQGIKIAQNETFVNKDAVTDWAQSNGVHSVAFGATVLVHEFQHIQNNSRGSRDTRGEVGASLAGSAFAAKLPGYDGQAIKQLSDSHAAARVAGYL